MPLKQAFICRSKLYIERKSRFLDPMATLTDILNKTGEKAVPRLYRDFMAAAHGSQYDDILQRHDLTDPVARIRCLGELAVKKLGHADAFHFMSINGGLNFYANPVISHPHLAAGASIQGFENAVQDLFLNMFNQPIELLQKWSVHCER